ncbi:G protein-coupled glucose receptor regulating Gpa2-domain-containing protein [Kalaharituber pfeilii]|nr:G protein-coupled glucose receptor regulating Gpa2-domain-containing protein [Kalaharituber pfeilii]
MTSKSGATDYEDPSVMSPRELLILRSIAIVAASISLTSGLLVGYWFIRMKRSFRHHLIMLLICSDFWKASWQLIYPAVVFTQGKVDRASPFCQVTGFFISMGIEASGEFHSLPNRSLELLTEELDFAILVIAVHSALYIFRPPTALGEGGLYKYRYYLYGIWLAFPLLMAALAFANEANAYTSQGTYCYLPARPIWLRLALAWIPRYLILITILILYASIYVYVRIKFRTFRTNIAPTILEMDDVDSNALPTNTAPGRLPDLHSHGLTETEPENRHAMTGASDEPFVKNSDSQGLEKAHKFLGLPSFLHSHSPPIDGPTATAELLKRRYVIRRQLRLLFIYPLVYALMWVPPLISHSLQYTDYFANHPSFPLLCLVSFTLPVQCAVDCWLFATREKPWKYIPHSGRKTFWLSFAFWKHDCEDHEGARCPQAVEDEEELRQEVWRNTSRRNLSIEQRAAYARRERERKEAEQRRLEKKKQGSSDLERISEEGDLGGVGDIGDIGGIGGLGAIRKGSIGSGNTIGTAGLSPGKMGADWWDRVEIGGLDEDGDEDEEEEIQRGRKHSSDILSALEAGQALSTDTTVRDHSSNSTRQYGSAVDSGRESRNVSVSGTTSTTKRDSGSVIDEATSPNGTTNGNGWEGSAPVETQRLPSQHPG